MLAPIYFVDRIVTASLQALSLLIEKKLRISLNLQISLLRLLASLIIIFYYVFHKQPPQSSSQKLTIGGWIFLIVFGILITSLWIGFTTLLPILWKRFHMWVDYQEAVKPDKLYSDGYEAWSSVLIALVILGLSIKGNELFFLLFSYYHFVDAYAYFTHRSRGKGKGFMQAISEALRKLLERVKAAEAPAPV